MLLTPKDAPVTDTYKHTWWYHGVWKCHGFGNLLTLLPERVCYQQPLVEWMEISIQKWFFGLTQVFVRMHYIHTTPAQTPKLSGPQFQTFFWGFPLYKPICFRWNLENIYIYIYILLLYITLIFPKIFNTTQIYMFLSSHVFGCLPIRVRQWPWTAGGSPPQPDGPEIGFSWDCLGSHEIAWVLILLFGLLWTY